MVTQSTKPDPNEVVVKEGMSEKQKGKLHASDDEIIGVAYNLHTLGLLKDHDVNVAVNTGVFTPELTAGVKAFQEKVGLNPDGVVHNREWDAMNAITDKAKHILGKDIIVEYENGKPVDYSPELVKRDRKEIVAALGHDVNINKFEINLQQPHPDAPIRPAKTPERNQEGVDIKLPPKTSGKTPL